MASITLRNIKGSPLTITEMDNNFSNLNVELGSKLDVTAYTATDVLNKIKAVDGATSGLDADLLHGYAPDQTTVANTIAVRDASSRLRATTFIGNLTGNVTGNVTGSLTGDVTGNVSGTASGITTVLQLSSGGTGATTAAAARTNLGLGTLATKSTVATADIDAGAVTNAKIATQAITSDKIEGDAINSFKIADAAVGNEHLQPSSVTSGKIADSAVSTTKLINGAVTDAKLASNAVTSVKVSNSAITTDKLANDAVTAAKIAPNAVGASEIVDNVIGASKLNVVGNGTLGQVLTSDADGSFSWANQDSGITTTTGSAPYYAARAWCDLDGTGTATIDASGNISSVTDNGTGDYTLTFTTAMPDTNYTFNGNAGEYGVNVVNMVQIKPGGRTTSSVRIQGYYTNGGSNVATTVADWDPISVVIFR